MNFGSNSEALSGANDFFEDMADFGLSGSAVPGSANPECAVGFLWQVADCESGHDSISGFTSVLLS